MRIVNRESVPESMLLRLAESERPVEVEAVIDVNGRVKVSRISEAAPYQTLAKPKGVRFAILPSGSPPRRLSS